MLWLKSWIEIRWRFALAVFLVVYIIYLTLGFLPPDLMAKSKFKSAEALGVGVWQLFLLLYGGIMLPIAAQILAGSGLNAQTAMGMSHGFHGSISFLLSMPVSRTRLLAVRAGLGLGLLFSLTLVSFAAAIWFSNTMGVTVPAGMWPHVPNILIFSTFCFATATLLSTFLDEFWTGMLSVFVLGTLGGYSGSIAMKAVKTSSTLQHSGNIFDMGGYLISPNAFEPLSQSLLLLALIAAQFLGANYIANRREY